MNELITSLTEKAGITTEQAIKSIEAVKDFVKEKFPMMAGAVDTLFAPEPVAVNTSAVIDTTAVVDPTAPHVSQSMLDKISDVIPGETGEKVEDFVKDTAHKVEDAFGSLKDKVSHLFGDKK